MVSEYDAWLARGPEDVGLPEPRDDSDEVERLWRAARGLKSALTEMMSAHGCPVTDCDACARARRTLERGLYGGSGEETHRDE